MTNINTNIILFPVGKFVPVYAMKAYRGSKSAAALTVIIYCFCHVDKKRKK